MFCSVSASMSCSVLFRTDLEQPDTFWARGLRPYRAAIGFSCATCRGRKRERSRRASCEPCALHMASRGQANEWQNAQLKMLLAPDLKTTQTLLNRRVVCHA